MGTIHLSKFSSQANPEILNILRQIADIEGKKFHAVLDEAFRDFLNKKGVSTPDRQVKPFITMQDIIMLTHGVLINRFGGSPS